jgi:hypothetical protein
VQLIVQVQPLGQVTLLHAPAVVHCIVHVFADSMQVVQPAGQFGASEITQ